ncbi:MAG: serine/threonine protein kinase [Verrucomicrobia bacterium]|nr:serine/threonine protein kinase [Verrucomicrobiota bacterium]
MITGEFEGYSIVRNIFKGGMTDVYVALDPGRRRVILRILKDEYVRDRRICRAFNESGEILQNLDHPRIVRLLDRGKHDRSPYMILEYHESQTLRDLITQRVSWVKEHALDLIRQLADALYYVHSSGFLHLDVKPENILIREDRNLVLIDFDLATPKRTGPFKVKRLSGTPAYLSPETLALHVVDDRSDIFSFGVTCYETVTCEKPYPPTLQGIDYSGNPAPLQTVPAGLSSVILKCLAKKPEYRYPSMSLIVKDLVSLS